MTFRFLAEDFDRYIKKGKPGDGVHNGRHIWDDLRYQLKEKFGVPFSPAAWKTHGDWLELLWLAPYKSPRGTWANQAQFFLSRSIQDKKLQFGLCIEFEPLKGNTSAASERDGWCFLQQLQDENFARVLDALLTNNDWDATIRDWSDKLHSVAKNSAEIAAALRKLDQDGGWNVYIQTTLDANTAVAVGEEIGQRIMDGFMSVRPLWEAVIPEADRKYLRSGGSPVNHVLRKQANDVPPVEIRAVLATNLTHQGLHFTPWQLATFYTALQTKGFVILSGISGTGKTRLAQAFAGMLPQPAEGTNHLFVPVRPDWRDSKSLLGYYNPLTGTYEWTPFLRFLLRAVRSYETRDGLAWFVILDEMNLAHVEYYFADLLSVLESGRDEDGWTREPLRLGYPDDAAGDLPPRELRLPPNLYIVGTVNVDETTHAFSPKVLDRAFTLELTDVDFSAYPAARTFSQPDLSAEERGAVLKGFTRAGAFARIDKPNIAAHVTAHPEVRSRLQSLNDLLRPHDLHFGYRVFDEIVAFLAAAESNKLYDDLDGAEAAFDAAVLMKVLPKFHGSRSRLETPLCAVLTWCANPGTPDTETIEKALQAVGSGKRIEEALEGIRFLYPETARRAQRMLDRLYTDGFAAFG